MHASLSSGALPHCNNKSGKAKPPINPLGNAKVTGYSYSVCLNHAVE